MFGNRDHGVTSIAPVESAAVTTHYEPTSRLRRASNLNSWIGLKRLCGLASL
jgi:hypothetical protein